MKAMILIFQDILYISVGLISLVMAFKSILSKSYLSFHEEAAGKRWEDIDMRLRYVILALLRLVGLGFLVTGMMLIILPVIDHSLPNTIYSYLIPVISVIYCSGVAVINYLLFENTGAETPWKGSIAAAFIILTGIIFSLFI